jgi:hypothetical protein
MPRLTIEQQFMRDVRESLFQVEAKLEDIIRALEFISRK